MEDIKDEKTAFLFPGQGAQNLGMGKDFYQDFEEARKIFDEAEKISNMPIKKMCFEGPEELLQKTENTQMAIFVTSLAILEVLKNKGYNADIAVGLSLGEYVALVYAGILSFEDGIKLIKKRGYYMGNLLPNTKEKFAMAAVMGLESSKIEEICKEISNENESNISKNEDIATKTKFVVPANYNCSTQTVISGNEETIEEAVIKLKEAGAKKVITLKTNGPFHTIKLQKAKEAFADELEKICFKMENTVGSEKNIKVIKNIDGTFYNKEDNIKEILANHIISPVRFDKAIKLMQEQGVKEFIEIGPGKALTGFVKREDKEAKVYHIDTVKALMDFLEKKNS